jgi:integrase
MSDFVQHLQDSLRKRILLAIQEFFSQIPEWTEQLILEKINALEPGQKLAGSPLIKVICLGKMLRYAHEVELIEVVPRVKLLKIPPQKFDFLTFEELSRLTEALKADPERWALVLLGAEAGLRQGEIIALEWGDIDLVAGQLWAAGGKCLEHCGLM